MRNRNEIVKAPPKSDDKRKPEAVPSAASSSPIIHWKVTDKSSIGGSIEKPITFDDSSVESENEPRPKTFSFTESSLIYGPQDGLTLHQDSDSVASEYGSDSSSTILG